jgi:hypothetical protein
MFILHVLEKNNWTAAIAGIITGSAFVYFSTSLRQGLGNNTLLYTASQ